ncbi:MAG: hypothetical protein CM1200mP14_17220 [Gammaproteobacteria bacterium]|nr:MAG: hypothetical protein CM1200mP14_17220 [Gammaproteobacteria bacterium]
MLVPDFPDDPEVSLTFERDVEEAAWPPSVSELRIRTYVPGYLGAVIGGVTVKESPAWYNRDFEALVPVRSTT